MGLKAERSQGGCWVSALGATGKSFRFLKWGVCKKKGRFAEEVSAGVASGRFRVSPFLRFRREPLGRQLIVCIQFRGETQAGDMASGKVKPAGGIGSWRRSSGAGTDEKGPGPGRPQHSRRGQGSTGRLSRWSVGTGGQGGSPVSESSQEEGTVASSTLLTGQAVWTPG